jgi:hypothetical protein
MERAYWHRQPAGKPLFPDLLWSRPENRRQAGKLLIVGGNAHGFAAAADAYRAAGQAGIGTARVLLPDSLQPTVGKVLAAGEFAPSTPSGSFSRQALAELLAMAEWADGVLLAGDFGRNSETAVLLEQAILKYQGRLTLTKDAVDYFVRSPGALLERSDRLLVLSFAQLQKLAAHARFTSAFTFGMDLLRLVEQLHDFSERWPAGLITEHQGTILVASDGQVSTTPLAGRPAAWRVPVAAAAGVWWLQNPAKRFEALTTAVASEAVQDEEIRT